MSTRLIIRWAVVIAAVSSVYGDEHIHAPCMTQALFSRPVYFLDSVLTPPDRMTLR